MSFRLSFTAKCNGFLKDPSLEAPDEAPSSSTHLAACPQSGTMAALLASKLCVTDPSGQTHSFHLPAALRGQPRERQIFFPLPSHVFVLDGTRRHIHAFPLPTSTPAPSSHFQSTSPQRLRQPFKPFTLSIADLAQDKAATASHLSFGRAGGVTLTLHLVTLAPPMPPTITSSVIDLHTGRGSISIISSPASTHIPNSTPTATHFRTIEAAASFADPAVGIALVTRGGDKSDKSLLLELHYIHSRDGDPVWGCLHRIALPTPIATPNPTSASTPANAQQVSSANLGRGLVALFGLGKMAPVDSHVYLQVEPLHTPSGVFFLLLDAAGAVSVVGGEGGAGPSLLLSSVFLRTHTPTPSAALKTLLPSTFALIAHGRVTLHRLSPAPTLAIAPLPLTIQPPHLPTYPFATTSTATADPTLSFLLLPSPYTSQVLTLTIFNGHRAVLRCLQADPALCTGPYAAAGKSPTGKSVPSGKLPSGAAGLTGLQQALAVAGKHGMAAADVLEVHWTMQAARLGDRMREVYGVQCGGEVEGSVRYLLTMLGMLGDEFVLGLGAESAEGLESSQGGGGAGVGFGAGLGSEVRLMLHRSVALVLGVAKECIRRLNPMRSRSHIHNLGDLQRAVRRLTLVETLVASLRAGEGSSGSSGSAGADASTGAGAGAGSGRGRRGGRRGVGDDALSSLIQELGTPGTKTAEKAEKVEKSLGTGGGRMEGALWLPLWSADPASIVAALARRGIVTATGGWLQHALETHTDPLALTLAVLSALPCSLPVQRYTYLLPLPTDIPTSNPNSHPSDALAKWYITRALTMDRLGFSFHAQALLRHYLSAPAPIPAHSTTLTTPTPTTTLAELSCHLDHFCLAIRSAYIPPQTPFADWLHLSHMGRFRYAYDYLCRKFAVGAERAAGSGLAVVGEEASLGVVGSRDGGRDGEAMQWDVAGYAFSEGLTAALQDRQGNCCDFGSGSSGSSGSGSSDGDTGLTPTSTPTPYPSYAQAFANAQTDDVEGLEEVAHYHRRFDLLGLLVGGVLPMVTGEQRYLGVYSLTYP